MRNSASILAVAISAAWSIGAGPGSTLVRISGHVPQAASNSKHIGHLAGNSRISLSIALNASNTAGLADLIRKLHNPSDPQYGKYLTTAQFAQRYGAPQAQLTQITQYLQDRNLTVSNVHANGLLIEATGAAADVENAFQIQLDQYQAADGRVVYAPLTDPLVSDAIAGNIAGIVGLNTFTHHHPHLQYPRVSSGHAGIGSAAGGGLAPSDIKTAYGLNGITQTGTGQTLALFELDGYTASDISTYAATFGINNPPGLTNILVGGFNGLPGPSSGPNVDEGPIEVTLDIELMIAIAPGATKILVYEGPNTAAGLLATYSKIASDNLAPSISTSWGDAEDVIAQNEPTVPTSENAIFMEMAAQGQSIYAAAGDSGAFDDGTNLGVDDPAAQPYVVGVGGTTLSVAANEAYAKESSWGIPASGGNALQGGGGGVSSNWTIPSFQAGLATAANLGSSTMRNVPDVSLDANPNTGYYMFISSFSLVDNTVGGTSCAAPIWAAFTALVNEARAANKLQPLGYANLSIYPLGLSNQYGTDFHDVNDGTTNLHYSTEIGYDLATGWGSFNGTAMFKALTLGVLPPYAPAGLAAAPYNSVASVTWTAATGATSYAVSRGPAATGPFTLVAPSVGGTSYQDVGLTDGTPYFYQVTASNTAGTSGSSAAVSTTPALVVPRAPGNLAGKKGGS